MEENKIAVNKYKEVFRKNAKGGMPMAVVSVHEDDLNDNEDECLNVRVEIVVGGYGIATTLDNIIENHKKAWRYDELNK